MPARKSTVRAITGQPPATQSSPISQVPFHFDGMHRLIPSRFSDPPSYSDYGTVLSSIADNEEMLDDITLLDGATNDRIRTENRGTIGISTYELVYGIPNAHIVNAAFSYTTEDGTRFSDHTRGAWYASDEVETSVQEVAYHRAKHLGEIIVPELPDEKPDKDASTYDDWQADFRSTFHQLSATSEYAEYLQPEPVPQCYAAGQRLARELLEQSFNGILYPSVRRPKHLCLVCFRPALVYNPRREARLLITLTNAGADYSTSVSITTG